MNLLDSIYNAGVVGAGGAGFPTHKKLNCRVDYFIVNGAECEPLLGTDKYIMRNFSDDIIRAVTAVATEVGASEAVIGLKEKYHDEIQALENSIIKLNSNIKLFFLKSVYPTGDEHVLVHEITGRVIPPGGIPLNVGTVVSNVGTILNISDAIKGNPVTDKYVSVLGEVYKPLILKFPIGTSVMNCIEAAGGAKTKSFNAIMGGPMMGKVLNMEELKNRVITKTDGGIIVIPEDHFLVNCKNRQIKHIINQAKAACIQCSACTQMCPRHLLGHPLRPHKIMRAMSFLENNQDVIKSALICSECGICEMYACPMGLSPRKVNVYLKGLLREKGIKFESGKKELKPDPDRNYKEISVSRLVMRLNLMKYKDDIISDEAQEIKVSRVNIPLRQHIGKSAAPIVSVGENVVKGQLIAEVSYEDMGANIHASISGKVTEINDNIVIQSDDSEVVL